MSRSRDFFLGRQYIFPREAVKTAHFGGLIGCWFCKKFYKFSLFFCLFFRLIICICFAFCLASKWWAKGRKCGVEAKKGWIQGQKCGKSGKNQFFVFVQITGKKVYETGVLGEETGKTGAEKAFFVQI